MITFTSYSSCRYTSLHAHCAPVFLAAMTLLIAATSAFGQNIYYVNGSNGSDLNDGESWTTAFATIHAGITAAKNNAPAQVWVAQGTYKPSIVDRTTSFELAEDVAIYGGFIGSETELEQRDWQNNVTILSGDLAEDDPPLGAAWDWEFELDCMDDPDCVFKENSFLIVNAENVNSTAILDGFTITGGAHMCYCNAGCAPPEANSPNCASSPVPQPPHLNGGAGIRIHHASPIIRNCTITRNRITGMETEESFATGSAVHMSGNSAPRFENCTISENLAWTSGAGISIHDIEDGVPSPLFVRTTIRDNVAVLTSEGGAAVHAVSAHLTFVNCTISGNRSLGSTGSAVMYLLEGVTAVEQVARFWNCKITDNFSPPPPTGLFDSGAITFATGSSSGSLDIVNSTVARNTGGIAAISLWGAPTATIRNSILWRNFGHEWSQGSANPVLKHIYVGSGEVYIDATLVAGGEGAIEDATSPPEAVHYGTETPNLDPTPPYLLFVDPEADDYRLHAESPAIDAGENCLLPRDCFNLDEDVPGWDGVDCSSQPDCPAGSDPVGETVRHPIDLDGNARVFGFGCPVDMGAYEWHAPPLECAAADLDDDGSVGVSDLLILLGAWGDCADCTPGNCPEDLTGDCKVGVPDLLTLLGHWGPCDDPTAPCLSHLISDCLNRFSTSSPEFEACVDWVEEHHTIYPGQE